MGHESYGREAAGRLSTDEMSLEELVRSWWSISHRQIGTLGS
jgi:hypothetical protein